MMRASNQRGLAAFHGALQIVRLNWTQYLASGFVVAAGFTLGVWRELPNWLRMTAFCGAGLAAYWGLASIVVSWWVYDFAKVLNVSWLRDVLRPPPQRWVNLHAGLDQTTTGLREVFPTDTGFSLDFYDNRTMGEPSIARARALHVDSQPAAMAVAVDHLPLADEECDAVFLIFAAHEVRQPSQRDALFAELRRILKTNGCVVLVEHVRDVANSIAFGPGVLHFLGAGEWRRLAKQSGLTIETERFRTPFVRVFLMRK